jgi:predicted hotdog family 3-hydroxylacyl-ACP dehydratase
MLASLNDITRFIPQRHPVVMIHDLVEASDSHAITQLKINHDNIFVFNGLLTEAGMVENIAQTAAAQVGYQCAVKNIPVPIGYIAAVKNLKILKMPLQDSMITTSIKITNQVLDITVAEGRIEQENELCCICEMRIFVKTQL